jgi:hypothetical protein
MKNGEGKGSQSGPLMKILISSLDLLARWEFKRRKTVQRSFSSLHSPFVLVEITKGNEEWTRER